MLRIRRCRIQMNSRSISCHRRVYTMGLNRMQYVFLYLIKTLVEQMSGACQWSFYSRLLSEKLESSIMQIFQKFFTNYQMLKSGHLLISIQFLCISFKKVYFISKSLIKIHPKRVLYFKVTERCIRCLVNLINMHFHCERIIRQVFLLLIFHF